MAKYSRHSVEPLAYIFPSEHDEQYEVKKEYSESQRHIKGAQSKRHYSRDDQQAQQLA
jgi:hypothetical protein